jgi:hypothetical protein
LGDNKMVGFYRSSYKDKKGETKCVFYIFSSLHVYSEVIIYIFNL